MIRNCSSQQRPASEYPTSLEIRLGRNRDEIGEGHGEDVTFNDGFICCVNAISPSAGSDLTSGGTLGVGTAKPCGHELKEISFCPWSAVSLYALCYCHTCSRKKGNTLFPEVKVAIFFCFFLVWNLRPENISNL